VTVQVAEEPVPDKLHPVSVPVPLVLIATFPVGVTLVLGEVSVTVILQPMPPLAFEQLTKVDVARSVTVMVVDPELAWRVESPL
jgi:hypothetical protein